MSLLAILFAITVTFYPYVIKTWEMNRVDTELRDELSSARDIMSSYLMRAHVFTVADQGRIYFTANTNLFTPLAEPGTFYLYNPADPWPSAYSNPPYELKYTTQPGFGSGRTIAYGINSPGLPSPPQTGFSNVGNQITVTLNATKNTQNLIIQFAIRPRNR